VVYQYENGVRMYALCRTTHGCYGESSSILMGSKGIAYPVSGQITGENAWRYSGKAESPYVIEHREFIKSIREGNPLNCGEYMGRSTLVGVMGQLSCYSGKEVTWDAVSKSNYCLGPKPAECTWDMAPPTQPDANGSYPVCAVPGTTQNI
jgi:myo-inositol 2-dehydrogenase/D-chiro-inositol 1-dehydrogenase